MDVILYDFLKVGPPTFCSFFFFCETTQHLHVASTQLPILFNFSYAHRHTLHPFCHLFVCLSVSFHSLSHPSLHSALSRISLIDSLSMLHPSLPLLAFSLSCLSLSLLPSPLVSLCFVSPQARFHFGREIERGKGVVFILEVFFFFFSVIRRGCQNNKTTYFQKCHRNFTCS